MIVYTIKRKNYEITVLKTCVGLLDERSCSKKFLNLKLNPDDYVYVKCTAFGDIDYRGKKQQYRLYDPMIHEYVSHKIIVKY